MAHSDSGGLSFILVKHLGTGDIFLFEGRDARDVFRTGLHHDPLYRGSIDGVLSHMKQMSHDHFLRVADCAVLRTAQPPGAAAKTRDCAS